MKIQIDESILFWAFRYALGRMTYAVGDVGDTIVANKHLLSDKFKKNVIHEIREKEYKNELGMDCDKACWLGVKRELSSTLWKSAKEKSITLSEE